MHVYVNSIGMNTGHPEREVLHDQVCIIIINLSIVPHSVPFPDCIMVTNMLEINGTYLQSTQLWGKCTQHPQ